MSRKTRTPEEQARREKIRALLQESNATGMASRTCSKKRLLNLWRIRGRKSVTDTSRRIRSAKSVLGWGERRWQPWCIM